MFKIILLNGPKLSGKDTLADLIESRQDYVKMQFKTRLYEIGAMVAGMKLENYIELCSSRVTKDESFEGFNYQTPREHLIHVSENVVKPLLGKGYFGDYLTSGIENCLDSSFLDGVVISDSGFEQELESIVNRLDAEPVEVHVIRLHKEGCTFEGDSRNYLVGLWEVFISYHDITVVDGDIEGTYESIQAACGGF